MSLKQILSDKLGVGAPAQDASVAKAPATPHTLTVQMPAQVHELTKAMAINLSMDHPVLIEMLFAQMGEQVKHSLEALIQARRAQQHLAKLQNAYESTITQARSNLHSLIGEHSAQAL